jgi:hypothetical protein
MGGSETADIIKKAAKAAGLNDSAVDRAKKKLGVKATQSGFGTLKKSLWELPGAMAKAGAA